MARGLPTGGQGSKVYVLCAEHKEHTHFRPGARPGGSGTRPGGSVTGVTKKVFKRQMFMCLFRPLAILRSEKLQNESSPNFSIFRPEFCPEICSQFLEEFSCLVSWETETRKNAPKIPGIFQCKIPRPIRRKNPQKFSGEQAK